MSEKKNQAHLADDLRARAEARAREQADLFKDGAALSPAEIQRALHELRVHQIELEMQNENLRAAQAELEASRERYFELYDLAPVGYCTLSERGLILEANLTTATLLGVARSALVKQPLSRFIRKEDQDIYYRHRKQLFGTDEPQACELRLVKPDGATFWAHLSATVAQATDGAPVCRIAIINITARKIAEEYLQKFKQIVASTAEGISLLDTTYRYVIVNEAYETFSGKRKEELIGVTVAEYLGEAVFYDHIKPQFDRCLNGETIRYQNWFEYPTLGKRFVEVTYYPYIDTMGEISGVVANTRDITERKQAEEALRESAALLDAAGRIAHFGGWSIDLAENIVTWSEQVAAIHEMPPGFSPSVEEGIGFYAPEWRERLAQVFGVCAHTGQPYDEEMEIITARGKRVWVRTTGEAVRDETGAIVRIQGAFQDITARKRAEAQLAEQLDDLRRWYEITLGREGRVMELKREVNALLAQTAQPPRYLSVVEDPDED